MARNTSDEQPTSAEPLPQFSANIMPHHVWWLVLNIAVASSSKNIRINFLPSQLIRLLAHISPNGLCRWSFRFCPPDCYQLSPAGTSSLLRIHLPPYTASVSLELPLEPPYPNHQRNDVRLPQLLRAPCERSHPQSHCRSDQVPGFTLFCTFPLLLCRIRFACAVYHSLPIASFRPCRCRQRPCDSDCLPLGRGGVRFFQRTGFARLAGQTKKRPA